MKDIGPTGKFPNGKLNNEDEGELKIAVGTKDGVVMILFGSPVSWIGLPKKEALDLAQLIIDNANEL